MKYASKQKFLLVPSPNSHDDLSHFEDKCIEEESDQVGATALHENEEEVHQLDLVLLWEEPHTVNHCFEEENRRIA